MNYTEQNGLLKTAIKASLLAGKVIEEIYLKGFEVEIKEDKTPLTEADKASNDLIVQHLKETQIPILSEESKLASYEERKNWQRCWVVDPLDGTKEFIKRNGEFTVNIALIENEKPIIGVIYAPIKKEIYFTKKNHAYKSTLNSHNLSFEEVIILSKELKPKTSTKPIRVVGSRSHMNEDTLDFIQELKSQGKEVEVVSKGSSLKFCMLAEGEADLYPRFAPTMEWDTAAGQAICEAVGFKVIDQQTKEPMRYNRENLLNSYFLVTRV